MSVTKADSGDKANILKLWRENFAFDDDGYTDFYFNDGYEKADNYLIKDKNNIITCLQVLHHQMHLNDKTVDYAFIVGVITAQEYRRQGYMKKLLTEVLDQIREPLTLIQGYKPEIYYDFGFKPLYHQKRVLVRPMKVSSFGWQISVDRSPEDMAKLYHQFIGKRNGAKVRDVNTYIRLKGLLKAMGRKLLFLDKDGKLVAYLIYDDRDGIKIEELIYREREAASVLLSYFNENIELLINDKEENLIDQIIEEKGEFLTLVRFNDPVYTLKYQLKTTGKERSLYFNEYE